MNLQRIKYSIICLLTIVFLVSPDNGAGAEDTPAGRIFRLEGSAMIVRKGNELNALANEKVFQSDEIKTGPDGLAELLLLDGSSVHLGPDSHLILSRYKFSLMEDDPNFICRMVKGIFVCISGAISKLHPGAIKFETPEGIVVVKGTKLFVSIIEPASSPGITGKTTIVLLKDPNGSLGQADFSNDYGQTSLDKENFSVAVNQGMAPPPQVFMDRATLGRMVPQNLAPVVFENYAPPNPYTEAFESSMEQQDTFGPRKPPPVSFSVP